MKMKTTTLPTLRRKNPYLRKPVCITLHPSILARLDKRSGNRSEQINCDLARLYLIEDGRGDMTPEERRRFKTLALLGQIHEEHEKQIGEQETATNREKQPTPIPTPSSPELKSPMVMTAPSETEHEIKPIKTNAGTAVYALEDHRTSTVGEGARVIEVGLSGIASSMNKSACSCGIAGCQGPSGFQAFSCIMRKA
jgi:hypothetical protein